MRLRYKNQAGVSIIELMTTIAILGLLMTIGIVGFDALVRKSKLEFHLQSLASAIKLSRTVAMNEGTRAVIVVVDAGEGAQDLDGNGTDEHYLSFIDLDKDSRYDAGETVIDKGNWDTVRIEENTLPNNYPDAKAKCFFFLPQGTAPGIGAADREIRINYNGQAPEYRLNLMSYLGAVEVEKVGP